MSVFSFIILFITYLFQGMLSFLSAPLVGALSDVWGRKPFLLLTVSFTCAPIPLMKISPWYVHFFFFLLYKELVHSTIKNFIKNIFIHNFLPCIMTKFFFYFSNSPLFSIWISGKQHTNVTF